MRVAIIVHLKPRGIFDVTEFDNRSGSSSWRVTGTKATGERVRKNFTTKSEAARWLKDGLR